MSFTEPTDMLNVGSEEIVPNDYWWIRGVPPGTLLPSLLPSDPKTINTYLPMEFLREIFLYSIEANQMTPGHLASVCRSWRSVIIRIASIWSTLRVGTWTEKEQVAAWLQRAHPKRVVIDTQRGGQKQSDTPPFSALLDALACTNQWHELTISSFPPEYMTSEFYFRIAAPMNVLRVLHVKAGCVRSTSLQRLLELVPTGAPLSELGISAPFARAHFFQPRWFPVLQNLRVFIVNGRGLLEPFHLLPAFTQLQIWEADHLPLPLYDPDTNLPLLSTLRGLKLRASSVQWMAGREFPCLTECAILLPHHWRAVQGNAVQLPSCRKFTYRGYPMTIVQYFHTPQAHQMGLESHDPIHRRVNGHLYRLVTLGGSTSKLTSLHLTLQCSGKGLLKVLKFMKPLQTLVLSAISSWGYFLGSLIAKPSTRHRPEWDLSQLNADQWEKWCSSQSWHTNILPYLKYLGVRFTRRLPFTQCLDISLLLRLVAWSRKKLTPPLEHLEVWLDDTVVDYFSSGSLGSDLGIPARDYDWRPEISAEDYDQRIVRAIFTRYLMLDCGVMLPSFKGFSSTIFRQLQTLELNCNGEVNILPYLKQIKELIIWSGDVPTYSLDIDLPLVHTLHTLKLCLSTISWVLGRTFKALRECIVDHPKETSKDLSRWTALQVDMPACMTLVWRNSSVIFFPFISCPNLQILEWGPTGNDFTFDDAGLTLLHNFLLNCSCLRKVEISSDHCDGLDSLIQLVFCDAWAGKALPGIKSMQVVSPFPMPLDMRSQFFNRMVQYKPHYEKWWDEFTVTNTGWAEVNLRASSE
jgi:hypothetical protein